MESLTAKLLTHENVWQDCQTVLSSEGARLIKIKETGSKAIDELMGKMSLQLISANDVAPNGITSDKLGKIVKIAVDVFGTIRKELHQQGNSETSSTSISSSVSSRPGLHPPQPPFGSDSDESFSRWSNEALNVSRKRHKMDENENSTLYPNVMVMRSHPYWMARR